MAALIVEDVMVPYGNINTEKNVFDTIKTVKEGIKYAVFFKISKKTPFNMAEWSAFMHVSDRTLLRYKNDNLTFDSPQTERVLQISILYDKGLEVFGKKEYLDIWLNTNSIALGGLKPKDLLDNSFGINLVSDELVKIEHGVLA
jgi:putative toxin-antitoxin system antitoxin component (TIGR02293 family)